MSRDRDHIINFKPLTAILKGADARINVRAQEVQFLNVLQHLSSDILLIRLRQLLESFHRCVQRIRHATEYTIG